MDGHVSAICPRAQRRRSIEPLHCEGRTVHLPRAIVEVEAAADYDEWKLGRRFLVSYGPRPRYPSNDQTWDTNVLGDVNDPDGGDTYLFALLGD